MPTIHLTTIVNAPIQTVFDLSRSVELHQISTAHTNETAIAGKTSGLMEYGDTVTWRAKHLGIYQQLTSKITKFDSPNYFVDEMSKGAFKSFHHEHLFEIVTDTSIKMTDTFTYISPFGFIGKIADYLFLKKYMTALLTSRNLVIKQHAEIASNKITTDE